MSTTGQSLLSNAHARLLHAGSQLPSPSDENIMAEQSLLPVLDKSNTSHLVSKSYYQANPVSMNSVSSSKNPGLNEIGTGLPKGPAGVKQVATGSDRASGRALLGSILLQTGISPVFVLPPNAAQHGVLDEFPGKHKALV